ncbi:choline transporter-like protein 4 [Protopterus annectens]|uniref:choline transporter-like protein 4 n=1 Tax=Protopterus annectens TaxID=7888 RepID=UPI001CFC2AF7|nr:choline transporter-like protein 4 [Protopterus annectens]
MGKKENSSEPYGEPSKYDPAFNGPIRNRSCTDIICCVLFLVFIAGYMIVGILAWLYGDPRQVIYPRNSTGSYCGFGPNQDKPFVLYFDIMKCINVPNSMAAALNGLQCPTTQICVAQCPTAYKEWITCTSRTCLDQNFCVPSINLNTTTLVLADICSKHILKGLFPSSSSSSSGAQTPSKPKSGSSEHRNCSSPKSPWTLLEPPPKILKLDLTSSDLRTPREILQKEYCPTYTIPSTPFLNRCFLSVNFTLPNDVHIPELSNISVKNATGDILNGFNFQDIGVRIFQDFAKSWYWILIGLVIAMIVSLLFLLLLRFIAGILIWILIIGVIGVTGYGIWHCYWEYDNYNKKGATINNIGFTTNFSAYVQVKETWLAIFIILIIVEVIILLVLIFLRTRILIAIALIKEASRAVGYIMSSLLYPLVTFVLLLVCVAYWGITALYLATSGEPLYTVMTTNSSAPNCNNFSSTQFCSPLNFNASNYSCQYVQCAFYKYNNEGLYQRNIFNLQLYNVVGFLWCMNFVIALGQCTLAGAFASYYWAFDKPRDIPSFPVTAAFMRSLRLRYIGDWKIYPYTTVVRSRNLYIKFTGGVGDAQNPCTKFLLCCLKCCFWCLEKFIKFLNRNAYIMIAIYGKNFCVSAMNAFKLLMRNIVRVVVLDKVTDLLLFFGKLLVVGGVGVLAFFFFSGRISIPDPQFQSPVLNYYWIPILTLVVGSYMIAQGFFSVYNMCVDTLFLCFLEDLERNDGSAEKPYFMSKSLMKILNKKNKKPKEEK